MTLYKTNLCGDSYLFFFLLGSWTQRFIHRASCSFETLSFKIYTQRFMKLNYSYFLPHYSNILILCSDVGIGPAVAHLNQIQESSRYQQKLNIIWFAHKPDIFFAPVTNLIFKIF